MSKTLLPINGILLINKPQGITSQVAVQQVKRLYQAKKAGHTGSLDPLATGMLPICFGEATKFCSYLLATDKSYQATGRLGIKTNTGDALGEVVSQTTDYNITHHQLQDMINQFKGSLQQVPPMFSALKHRGTPLYKLARKGVTVERAVRNIVIDDIHLIHFDGQFFSIDVRCSKGTYIRSLIEEIGERLGVYAHVTQLHRLYTGHFVEEIMYDIDALNAKDNIARLACLLPAERAVMHLPVIELSPTQVILLRHGRAITCSENVDMNTVVRLHDENNGFIGLGEMGTEGMLKVKRLLAVIPASKSEN